MHLTRMGTMTVQEARKQPGSTAGPQEQAATPHQTTVIVEQEAYPCTRTFLGSTVTSSRGLSMIASLNTNPTTGVAATVELDSKAPVVATNLTVVEVEDRDVPTEASL